MPPYSDQQGLHGGRGPHGERWSVPGAQGLEAHWLLILSVKVITPEEIVDPNVDEHSVMTYLSQFPKAKLKPGAPVRSKQVNPKKAIAYGPGMC